MTDHYVVDSGSRLKAWDVNAYTQAIVTATKEGKIIDVDSAVKIGNEWEVRYALGDPAYEEAKELTQTLVEAEESHKAQADAELVTVIEEPAKTTTNVTSAESSVGVSKDLSGTPNTLVEAMGIIDKQPPPPAEPKPKATRKRRAPRTS